MPSIISMVAQMALQQRIGKDDCAARHSFA
jgi:hypothetical protein